MPTLIHTVRQLFNNSYLDTYIAKFNSVGTSQWVIKSGGFVDDETRGVFVDASGNIYQTGYYTGTVFFGTKPLNPFGTKDYFIAKYDNTGAFQWVKNGGSTVDDIGSKVVKNGTKLNVFGTFSGTGFFDKNVIISGSGNANSFLQKIEE